LFFSMQWIATVKETVQRHRTASSPTALGRRSSAYLDTHE